MKIPVVPRRAPVSALTLLVGTLLLAPGVVAAQARPSGAGASGPGGASLTVVHRLTGPIVLDGVVDEPAWDLVPPVPLFQHIPTVGGPLSERTDLRIAHDDDYVYLEEDLRERFELSDEAWVPAGRYRALEGRIGYTMPIWYPLRSNVDLSAGRFLDGTRRSVSLSPFWTPTPRLKVTGAYIWNHITFGARDQVFTAHVARVQPELMFDTRVSVSALARYNSAAADFSVNARLRINPREGTDFYLVLSESLRTDELGLLAPVPPRSRGRTLLLKYSRTLFP